MQKTLVVHFSGSGHARRVADEIVKHCGADQEAIQDVRPRAIVAIALPHPPEGG